MNNWVDVTATWKTAGQLGVMVVTRGLRLHLKRAHVAHCSLRTRHAALVLVAFNDT
jgi:hypothetical protein